MLSEELVDIATRHQVYLERLKAGEVKKTDALFQRLNRDLLAVLNRLDDQDLGVLTLIERARLIEDIRKNQVEAYTEHLVKISAMLRLLSEFSRDFELESLDEVSDDRVEPDDGQEDEGAALWEEVQAQPMGATGALLAAFLAAWMANEVTRGSNMVRRAISEGWTVSQLVTAFRGTKATNYENGLYASARRNARATINTAIQHVSSAARLLTMAKTIFQPKGRVGRLKVDAEGKVTSIPRSARAAAAQAGIKVGDKIKLMGYRWVSILDDATTQICRSLDGQVFMFGEGPTPPAHINCRSSIIAELLGRWLKRGPTGRFVPRDERLATGAKGVERVDGGTTYYEWLKTQPAAFQNDALGVTRAKLFRDGGMSAATFAKLNLGRHFRPLTLAEMRRLKPNAFRRAGIGDRAP
jgi:SPP1 gp7 family putative phage head morphogenesis protein